jgi:hypothetical protein
MLFSKMLVVLRCRIFWSCAQQQSCDVLLLVKFAPRIGLWCWSEAQIQLWGTLLAYVPTACDLELVLAVLVWLRCMSYRTCAQHKPALCRFICCFTMNDNEAQAEAWVLVLFLIYWIFLWNQWWVMQSISLHNWGIILEQHILELGICNDMLARFLPDAYSCAVIILCTATVACYWW